MHVWATKGKRVKVDWILIFCLNLGSHFFGPIRDIVFRARRFYCFLFLPADLIFIDILLLLLHSANNYFVVVVQTVDVNQEHSKRARALIHFEVR